MTNSVQEPTDEPVEQPGPPAEPTEPASSGTEATSSSIAPRVFYPAAAVIVVFVAVALLAPDATSSTIGKVQSFVIDDLGWYYVLLVAVFVLFSLFAAFGPWASIRLGPQNEPAEFSMRSWLAMLFSAGMGIGLVFWGVAEPLNHLAAPKPGVSGTQPEIAHAAMNQTYLHWGVHAWGIYVVVGLAIAYAVHRRGRPVSIRWALEGLLGRRLTAGPLGDVIDVIAIVGTLFGVATSLGFGVVQLSAGLGYLELAPDAASTRVVAVCLITGLATLSVVTGLTKGIQWLSNANMLLAGAVLLFVLIAGPTVFLLREFVASIGHYLAGVLELTFDTTPLQGEEGRAWQAAWTTFYWGWWISWAPFVGVFIARISRGRTVREFVTGVLAVPTLLTFLWFSVLGGSAIYRELFGSGGLIGDDGSVSTNDSLFALLGGLPLGTVVSLVALALIVTFFVTSSDSGSLVVDMLASGGDPNPPTWSRIFWAVAEGLVALALLVIGGNAALGALQTTAIVIALPFSIVMIGMMVALSRSLNADSRRIAEIRRRERTAAVAEHVRASLDHDAQGRALAVRKDRTPMGVTPGRGPSREHG
ncbi:MAG: BCCT family transporter [Actinomycetota bacterium]|nr:BCCT family transporter [Actinomycetota bacterium]